MAADHDHTASRTHPRRPETHGAKRPRINSAYRPYGVAALGSIGSGTFLGGAGGGPGQPQAVGTSGGVSNGWVGAAAADHLSPDQFVGSGAFTTDAGNATGVAAMDAVAGNGGAGGPSAGVMSAGLGG
jgi:hypothetical protein